MQHPEAQVASREEIYHVATKTMSMEEAANELDIPFLAIGQVIFDGKLHPVSIDSVNRKDISELKDSEQTYLQTLRD